MEISVISPKQTKILSTESAVRKFGFCDSNKGVFGRRNQLWVGTTRKWARSRILMTSAGLRSEALQSEKNLAGKTALVTRSKSMDSVRLFVGLPLDAVSDSNTVNHSRAIAAGLKALKLLGLEGVELPIWWGVVEKEAMGKYDWSGYLALAKMIQDAGLKIHASLCFHGSDKPKIPLPQWVSHIGQAQPDVFLADRSGRRYTRCLSLAVDELPVLNGKTPMQVYQDFLESFNSSFSDLMGSTITDISIGLGPDGELRYPSYPPKKSNQISGVGEFQCYDKHLLRNLRIHAQAIGNVNWGLSGPHDAPTYYEPPNTNGFFREDGGSWETPYGNFFLSWYADELINHGDRLLSMASRIYTEFPVTLCAKVPVVHGWYKMRSHPSEMTAGFYNTSTRDGYDAVANMFSRNSCAMILPGMDLTDEHQPQDSLSSPELLLLQIKNACKKHRVPVYGENLSVTGAPDGLNHIEKNLSSEDMVLSSFLYQRMGAHFFSPEHFPSFTQFVRNLSHPKLHLDDMPATEENKATVSLPEVSEPGKNLQMQEA